MRILYKSLSVIGIIGMLCFSFFLGFAALVEGKHLIKPYVDTHFADDYSPEKFDDVKLGMTKDDVISLVGIPLNLKAEETDTASGFIYTRDGKLLQFRKSGTYGYDDYAWYRSAVGFDTNDVVIAIDKGWSYD